MTLASRSMRAACGSMEMQEYVDAEKGTEGKYLAAIDLSLPR